MRRSTVLSVSVYCPGGQRDNQCQIVHNNNWCITHPPTHRNGKLRIDDEPRLTLIGTSNTDTENYETPRACFCRLSRYQGHVMMLKYECGRRLNCSPIWRAKTMNAGGACIVCFETRESWFRVQRLSTNMLLFVEVWLMYGEGNTGIFEQIHCVFIFV